MVRSCHACVNLSRLHSGFLSHRRCMRFGRRLSSPSSRSGWHETSLHKIFKSSHLKFTVYGRKKASIHTHFHNAVTLVWVLLRLTPMRSLLTTITRQSQVEFRTLGWPLPSLQGCNEIHDPSQCTQLFIVRFITHNDIHRDLRVGYSHFYLILMY